MAGTAASTFCWTEGQRPNCYVEVKNAHLFRKPGQVEFPDCVTERGTKHLAELSDMVNDGHRAAMVYLVQAAFPSHLTLAADLDGNYVKAFKAARKAGVEAYALCCNVSTICHNRYPDDSGSGP